MKHAIQIVGFVENCMDKDTMISVMFNWKMRVMGK